MQAAPTIAQLGTHVRSIAQANEITIVWTERPLEAWAGRSKSTGKGVISVARITSPATYAIALHELGHILGRHQSRPEQIVRERWAWNWARAESLIWTTDMRRVRKRSLAGEFKAPMPEPRPRFGPRE